MADNITAQRQLREEHVISRIKIINSRDEVITVEPQFAPLFHGKTEIGYGVYEARYPVKNTEYNRLVTKLQQRYPSLKVVPGVAGDEVI